MEIWRKLLNRMMRAARMDTSLYEEIETDEEALGQAVMIALLASLATGLGMGLTGLIGGQGAMWFVWGLLSGFFASMAGWFAWVIMTYLSGTTFLRGPEKASVTELIKTIGFANSPGILRILIFLPMLGWIIAVLTGIWSLSSGAVAVRQTLDFSSGKAFGACLTGWLIYMAIILLVYIWIPSPYKMPAF
jgi:hypothetical protein